MVIAATNRQLDAAVRAGEFRQDLFYRLAVLRVELPPLRQRLGDVRELCTHISARYSSECRRPVTSIEPDALDRLVAYDWPGNVRELRNVIERAIILGNGSQIRSRDLPPDLTSGRSTPCAPPSSELSMAEMERELIQRALNQCDGNQTRAARMLKISRDTLRYRLKKHGLAGPESG